MTNGVVRMAKAGGSATLTWLIILAWTMALPLVLVVVIIVTLIKLSDRLRRHKICDSV